MPCAENHVDLVKLRDGEVLSALAANFAPEFILADVSYINVADAYADSRFDRSIDGQTGFVTRQVLAVPIVDDDERLVGCIQAINKSGSREPFTPADEKLVTMLATHIQLFTQELGV